MTENYTTLSNVYSMGSIKSKMQGLLVGSLDTMPTASQAYVGQAVLYTGQTSSPYSQNHIYVCQETDTDTYSWVEVSGGSSVVLTANKALISDSSGNIQASSISDTELSCLYGVTSPVQTQLDDKTDLQKNVGSDTKGIYTDSNGQLTQMAYSLEQDVPSDAVFTDQNVTQTASTGDNEYAILFRDDTGTTGNTDSVRFGATSGKLMTANPSTGTISAQVFNGALDGNADSSTDQSYAQKIGTSSSHPAIGSTTTPIYVNSSGEPTQLSYTIQTSVPENAVFTDVKATQTATTSNGDYPILIKNTADQTTETAGVRFGATTDKPITANPSTGTVTAVTFSGDLSGNASTASAYNTSSAIGGATSPIYINASGIPTQCTYSLQDNVPSGAIFTDENVAQTASTQNNEYALLMREDSGVTGNTAGTLFGSTTNKLMTANPSTGTITAPIFKGALDGNASTATSATSATSATNATNDSDGNQINTTYFKVGNMYTTSGSGASAGISSSDPIAMKGWVNSSIATNTANFLGTYDEVDDLGLTTSSTNEQIAQAIPQVITQQGLTATNNDYVFISINLSTTTDVDEYRRFKYSYDSSTSTGEWAYEYTLNNSSFTSSQWQAINSGVTSTDVQAIAGKLDGNNITAGTSFSMVKYDSDGLVTEGTTSVQTSALSGQVSVQNGGTGKDSLTSHNVLIGNGTSQLTLVQPQQGAFYATGNAVDPQFGTLPVNCGGTGQTSLSNVTVGKASALDVQAQVGGATSPIYINASGAPTQIDYTIAQNVPSDAVFTDQNVTQTATTTDQEYQLLFRDDTGTTGNTDSVRFGATTDKLMTANPSTGTITASVFVGDLTGNSSTASDQSYAQKVGTSASHPQIGSSTNPAYVNSSGEVTACGFTVIPHTTEDPNSSSTDSQVPSSLAVYTAISGIREVPQTTSASQGDVLTYNGSDIVWAQGGGGSGGGNFSIFSNQTASNWVQDNTYTEYPLRCAIQLTGVTANDLAEVTFSATNAISGYYAPVSETYAGGVYIYSTSDEEITIPSIVVFKG